MQKASEFVKAAKDARESVQREAYLVKRDFLDESLKSTEAKGSYIQFGYVKVNNEKLITKLQNRMSNFQKDYELTDGAIKTICEDADKQVEKFLKDLGWGLTSEGNLIPLEENSPSEPIEN